MDDSTMVLINANVVTLDPANPKAEAIAIRDGRILDIGSTDRIFRYATDVTRILDLGGKTVVPGFIDSHAHMLEFGHSLRQLDLRNVGSIRELQARLRRHAEETAGCGWILGGRWDQERFSEKRYPNRWDLDAAVSRRPVFLLRVCGHIGVVNSRALELAGINKETKVFGGEVDRDIDMGEPNGVIREEALELIWRAVPKRSLEEIEGSCLLACQKAVEAGLTSVNWLVSSAPELRIIHKLQKEDRLPVRVYLGIPVTLLRHLAELGLVTGFGNDMVKIGFVKILLDGSLGGHTAALNEPYADKQDNRGMLLYSQRRLNRIVLDAHKAGLQIAIHAIGDRAVDAALKTFEKALKSLPQKNHRHRIEHCSVLNLALIKRMKLLGIIASVQPHFIVSDFWVTSRLGKKRARWVYPFMSLLREGIVVAAGSDCPVEPIEPLLGMWAAMTRTDPYGENVSGEEALRMYTFFGAVASLEEDRRGSIEAGKFADLTVLSDSPCVVSPDKIKEISVEMVIVNGRIVYQKS